MQHEMIKNIEYNKMSSKDIIKKDNGNGTKMCGTRPEGAFESLYENAPIGIFVINQKKEIVNFNKEAVKIFGYKPEEIIGKHLVTLIPDRYRNFHFKVFGAVMGSPESSSKTYEFIGLKKNGEEFSAEFSFCLPQDHHEPVMIISARDISSRKGLEIEMKERADVLQEYLKLHNQWLVETEQKYNFDLNTVAEEMLCLDKSAVINKPLIQIMPEHEWEKSEELIKKIFKDVLQFNADKVMEGFIVNSQGREIPSEFCFRKIEKGAERQIVCMVRDISIMKQIEDQLIKSQKFEGLGVLIGGMVHNFKNIMTSIMGYVSLMRPMLTQDEKLCRYLNIVETSCTRASDLSREVLAVGKKQDTVKKIININSLIERSTVLFEDCIDKRFAVDKELDPALSRAECNESQVEQVLLNLLLNSRDAMPDGGEIFVRTQNIYLNHEACKHYHNVTGGNFIEILVKDSGSGMSQEIQKKMFDPFYTTKEEGRGTGLGLSTVERIVKNHRGFVEVFSREGQGTTFKIYVPGYEAAATNARANRLHPVMKKGSETILAVDDENKIIRLISESMGALGYNIISASDGKEAVKLFAQNKSDIDLVILDLMMPSMNGYEAFKEIKAIDPATKIILCTGYVADENVQEMLNNGVKGLLKKPYRIEDLSRAVRLVLDEQAAATPYYQQ
ncbi:MAG: PAS domain S-box protein [Proteobacteria bacterium]|nr:PAS domain S-box protein [Pseudomonadota bacterium]